MLSSSLGPNSGLNSEDILMEKESSSEEEKNLQGQGSSSNSHSQISQQDANESIEDLVKQLDKRQAWLQIEELVRLKTFCGLSKLPPSRDLFFSFFIQCSTLSSYPYDFAPALALAYRWLNEHNFIITSAVTSQYSKFFEKYKPHKRHSLEDLETLFNFCRAIQAPINWLHLLKDPELLMGEKAVLTGCCTSLRLLFECKTHYSHEYFALVDYVIGSKLAGPSVDGFVKMLKLNTVQIDKPWISLFQQYASIENTYTKSKTMKIGGQIFGVLERRYPCSLLMDIVEVAINMSRCEEIKAVLKSNLSFTNINEFKELLNLQVEKDKLRAACKKQEEQQKEQETKRQHAIKAKEDEQAKFMDQEKQRIEQQKLKEEQKRQELKESEEIAYKEKALQIYKALCEMNQQLTNEELFLTFTNGINDIASQLPIPVKVRPEQAASMYAVLTSKHKRTFMQLPTGTGKSLMFGLVARYTNQKRGVKVVLVVPNEVLAAIQQDKYCPWASKVLDDLYRQDVKEVFYCTYKDFRTGEIPLDAVILMDEVDALFFTDKPEVKGNKIMSTVLLLNKYEVIGMTATFRGDQGKKKILQFVKESHALKTTDIISERELQLDVIGKLKQAEVDTKVVEIAIAKQQELPVVIVLPSIEKCQQMEQYFQCCFVFGKGDVVEQVGCLKHLQSLSQAPWPIILTTSKASLGNDLANVAYVVQTELPDSFSTFIQNTGRGNRVDSTAPLVGAFITDKLIFDIAALKIGCEYKQQRQIYFRDDYLGSLELLEKCEPTTEPQKKALKQAVAALNQGNSFEEIKAILSKTAFKTVQAEFKAPEPMLRKRKEPEDNKKAAATKENTKDISSFFTSKQPAATSLTAFHQTLPKYENNIASGSAEFGALRHDEWQQNTVGLSSNTLDEFARQTGFKEISPSDSASQVGGDSSVLGSSATQGLAMRKEVTRKRDNKAAIKLSGATSEVSRSSSGRFEAKYKVGDKTTSGALVKEVVEEDWQFQERDRKGNSYYKCSRCSKPRILKSDRKKHACKTT